MVVFRRAISGRGTTIVSGVWMFLNFVARGLVKLMWEEIGRIRKGRNWILQMHGLVSLFMKLQKWCDNAGQKRNSRIIGAIACHFSA